MKIEDFSNIVSSQVKEAIKKAFNAGFQYAQSLNLNDDEFVDLGLPSGTKWAKEYFGVTDVSPEGDFFSYIESQKLSIPTEEQIQELKIFCRLCRKDDHCFWGVGPNGNQITFKHNTRKAIGPNVLTSYKLMEKDELGFTNGNSESDPFFSFWIRSESRKEVLGVKEYATLSHYDKDYSFQLFDANPRLYKHQVRLVKVSKPTVIETPAF